jgi:opacity protein-like surface antigen
MKRLIIILICIVSISLTANAQIKFGAKIGLTSTSIKLDETIDNLSNSEFDQLVVKGTNAKVGFQGGIFTRITIVKLYIQPELLFTSTSGEVEVTAIGGIQDGITEVKEQKFRQIDFPIMIGYKAGPLRLQAGPVGTIILSSDPALDMFENVDVEEEFNGATWGYQVGIGFDLFKKVTIDIKYEGSLSKLADGVSIGDKSYNFDSRNNQFVASVGFFF